MANSQQGARLVYRNAVKSMIRAGVDPRSAVLSQSYLRFEQLVNTTKTTYNFGVLQNDAGNSGVAQRQTEQRLALQDSFYVSSVQVLIANASSTTATNFPLYSYPSAKGWSAITDWYNLYNGYLSLTVNNRTIVTAWDIARHFETRTTQYSSANPTQTGVLDEYDGLSGGACETEPNWVLIGSKNNSLSINLPSAINSITATSSGNSYICVLLRGVLAQNVTVVS